MHQFAFYLRAEFFLSTLMVDAVKHYDDAMLVPFAFYDVIVVQKMSGDNGRTFRHLK